MTSIRSIRSPKDQTSSNVNITDVLIKGDMVVVVSQTWHSRLVYHPKIFEAITQIRLGELKMELKKILLVIDWF
jgi:hypothetical protein